MPATTALGFVRLLQAERPLPSDELFDPSVPLWLRDRVLLQVDPVHVTPADVRVLQPLGSGRHSVGFACVVHGRACAVKVPRLVLKLTMQGEPPHLPSDSLDRVADQSDVDRLFKAYACEAHYARKLLDPVDTPVHDAQLSREQVCALFDEREAMRRHPGFENIHRILHVELSPANPYPMLFSQLCDGIVEDLVDRGLFESTNHDAWRAAAIQIVHAFDYMRVRGVIHLDLCIRNVFFHASPDGRLEHTRYVISDFADMWPWPANEAWPHMARRGLQSLGSTLADFFLGTQRQARILPPLREAFEAVEGGRESAYRTLREALAIP